MFPVTFFNVTLRLFCSLVSVAVTLLLFAHLSAALPPFAFLFLLSTRLSWRLLAVDTLIELTITSG